MKKNIWIMVMLLGSISFAQEKTKVNIKYYQSGKIKSIILYDKNGFPGDAKYFFENGNIQVIGAWGEGEYTLKGVSSEKVGRWKYYHKNGKLALEGYFLFDKRDGEWRSYNEDGKLTSVFNYDTHIGKNYSKEGYLIGEGKFIDDKLDGEWKNYYNNGKLSVIFVWKENKLLGVKEIYNINGKAMDKGSLKKGNGTINFFDNNGKSVQYKVKDGKIIEIDGELIKEEGINNHEIEVKNKLSKCKIEFNRYVGKEKSFKMQCVSGNCHNGFGTYTWANGEIYSGYWLNNKRNGVGINKFADGRRYDGEWKDDLKHGFGIEVYIDGKISKGNWVNNKFVRE